MKNRIWLIICTQTMTIEFEERPADGGEREMDPSFSGWKYEY